MKPQFIILLLPIVVFFLEKLVFSKLRKLAQRTSWAWDEVLINAFKFMPTLWSLLIAIYVVSEELSIPKALMTIKDKALWLLLILSFVLITSKLLGGFLRFHMTKYNTQATSLIIQIINIVVFTVGIIIALEKVGIAITPILTAFGVGGLAVALALRETLENLFAGFHVLAARQIKLGDYIRLQSGEEGFVEDITWRNTILRHPSNNLIIVPNSKLSSSIITNFHMPQPELSVVIPIGVSYDSDLEKVEKVTLEVAKEVQREVEGAVQSFEPLFRYTKFDEFSINFNLILRAKDFPSQHILTHELIKRLKKRYEEEGIKIPFPVREVYLASGTEK